MSVSYDDWLTTEPDQRPFHGMFTPPGPAIIHPDRVRCPHGKTFLEACVTCDDETTAQLNAIEDEIAARADAANEDAESDARDGCRP